MRSYENSGYNPFNENDRGQSRSSARNYYSDEFDMNSNRIRSAHDRSNRQSSGEFGTDRNTFGSSGYGNASTQGRSDWGSSSHSSPRDSFGSSSSRLNDYRNSNQNDYSNNWNRNNNRNDSIWDRDNDRNQSSWSRNDHNQNSWDRTGDRIENSWENAKNKVSNAWDRMTDNDDDNYSNRSSMSRNLNTYGSTGSTSNYGNSYGSHRDTDRNSGMGNRYSSDSYNSHRDNDNDRGFFDRAGDEVKSWFGDDEAERRRRMDEMRDRQEDRDFNSNYRRSGSTSYGSTNDGPPYSFGSSSRRDYEW